MEVIRLSSLLLAGALLLPASGQKRPESYAVVAGTVFRDPGYALPEAKVTLSSGDPKPKKIQEALTNYRGEFLFRVPPRDAKYVLKATMKGYRAGEKEASVHGEEHVEVNLVLVPEVK